MLSWRYKKVSLDITFRLEKVPYLDVWKRNRILYEPAHEKTNKMVCAPSEDSDQPGYPPSLISLR